MVPMHYFVVLSAILFGLGVIAFIFKRNIITIFMSIELMLNAVNLAFVAFSQLWQRLDGQVEVSVTDTGIGIAAEDQEAVFEEFRQVGTDYAKKHEGTGLGLTLSRKFVELHGGRIWVKSAPRLGSTFAFTLPERPWPAS